MFTSSFRCCVQTVAMRSIMFYCGCNRCPHSGGILKYISCRVINLFVISEFRIEVKTQYFRMHVHVYCSVVYIKVESSVIFCMIRSEGCTKCLFFQI